MEEENPPGEGRRRAPRSKDLNHLTDQEVEVENV
jgi:hypothetical protein